MANDAARRLFLTRLVYRHGELESAQRRTTSFAVNKSSTSALERALQASFASRSRWRDYLFGAALAFDPLPSTDAVYYCDHFEKNDFFALKRDLAKLLQDKEEGMKKFGMLDLDNLEATLHLHAQAASKLEKAG